MADRADAVAPHPNGIGVYFDLDASVNCVEAPVDEIVEAYLILTHSTEPSGVFGWEMVMEINGPTTVLTWQHVALNLCCFVPPPELCAAYMTPLPFSGAIHLMTIRTLVEGDDPIQFTIHPASYPSLPDHPGPVYVAGDDLTEFIPMWPAAGFDEFGEPNPVAAINGPCPVPNHGITWGAVKAGYR